MKLRTLVVLAGLGAYAARKLRVPEPGDSSPPQLQSATPGDVPTEIIPDPAEVVPIDVAPPSVEIAPARERDPAWKPEPATEDVPVLTAEIERQSQPETASPAVEVSAEIQPEARAGGEAEAPGEPESEPLLEPLEPAVDRSAPEWDPPERAPDAGSFELPVGEVESEEAPSTEPPADDRAWPYSMLPDPASAGDHEAGPASVGHDEPAAIPLVSALDAITQAWATSTNEEPPPATADVEAADDRSEGESPDGWSVVVYPEGDEREDAPRLAAPAAGAVLHGVPEIRRYFRTMETPVVFVAPSAFGLLGWERWVHSFVSVNHYDSFDGRHPDVFVPTGLNPASSDPAAALCNRLLLNPQVVAHLRPRAPGRTVILSGDAETDALVEGLGFRLAGPDARLRRRLESRVEMTRLAA